MQTNLYSQTYDHLFMTSKGSKFLLGLINETKEWMKNIIK